MNWKTINQGQFFELKYWPEKAYFKYINFPNLDMEEDVFRKNMLDYAKLVEKYQPKLLLLDTSQGQFTINPALQEWVAREIAPRTTCIKKIANLLSNDVFALVSVEQMMEEKEIADFYEIRYFDNAEEAEKWLLGE
jgi:hypothetical protein